MVGAATRFKSECPARFPPFRVLLNRLLNPLMRVVLALLRACIERLGVDLDCHMRELAGEGEWRLVLVGRRRPAILADIEGLRRAEAGRHDASEFRLAVGLAVDE